MAVNAPLFWRAKSHRTLYQQLLCATHMGIGYMFPLIGIDPKDNIGYMENKM